MRRAASFPRLSSVRAIRVAAGRGRTAYRIAAGLAAATLVAAAAVAPLAADAPGPSGAPDSLVDYLSTWKIDLASRGPLTDAAGWTDDGQRLALKIMARLSLAPPALAAGWRERATPVTAGNAALVVGDRFVRVAGRAVFVAPRVLPADQSALADRGQIDVVRIVGDDGVVVDVLTAMAPRGWARWKAIDEPAAAVGLPLVAGRGPRPGPPPADGAEWPADPAAILLAADHVAWHPRTALGGLGADYGLFDTVVDGQRLVAGDTEAFYDVLAAAGRGTVAGMEKAAGPAPDMLAMIDPGRDWFRLHRGDPVLIEGIARSATRIEIDDPLRRRQVGTDHYWELYVFVKTPLIRINDRLQESYPVVCCVRSLPEGMPTGHSITERVRVAGFALKRYGYPLPKVKGAAERPDQRQESPLVVGKRATWVPGPSPAAATSLLGWAFMALAAVFGLVLLVGLWSFGRGRRRGRGPGTDLPDRIELP